MTFTPLAGELSRVVDSTLLHVERKDLTNAIFSTAGNESDAPTESYDSSPLDSDSDDN